MRTDKIHAPANTCLRIHRFLLGCAARRESLLRAHRIARDERRPRASVFAPPSLRSTAVVVVRAVVVIIVVVAVVRAVGVWVAGAGTGANSGG